MLIVVIGLVVMILGEKILEKDELLTIGALMSVIGIGIMFFGFMTMRPL